MTLNTKILSIDYQVADTVITNSDLEKILDTSDEWIVSRTGIKQRRVAKASETPTSLGVIAAKKAIERAVKNHNFNPGDIDLIIAACSSPEDIYPSVACIIQGELGLKGACFDLRAACAGFIYSLSTAKAFISSGMYKNILIVATDTTTKNTDWNDRSTCVLFGDGAGAAIVSRSEEKDNIIGIELYARGDCRDFIQFKNYKENCPLTEKAPVDETYKNIQMKGKEVYKFVMQEIPVKINELLNKTNTSIEDIDYFIPHQSNQRMIEALGQRLGLDDKKVISNIAHYGNMSAASILVALRENIDAGKIKLPAKVIISAFGAGMTAANAIISLDKNI